MKSAISDVTVWEADRCEPCRPRSSRSTTPYYAANSRRNLGFPREWA